MRSHCERRAQGERGSALVLALVFLSVCGITMGGLIAFVNTNSSATVSLRVSRGYDYDAVAAMQGAIATVRTGSVCGSGASGFTPGWALNSASRPLRVDCTVVAPPIYDSTVSPLPHSMPSMAYFARSTAESGDNIVFAGAKRRLASVTVTLEDWALRSTYPTWPAVACQYPITLKLYTVDHSGANPAPGTLIVSSTKTFDIPWRPEPDPTCATPTYWRAPDNGVCYSSVPVNVTFDLAALNVDLPAEIVYGIAFNTQSYGTAPTGVDGPYNSLNLAVAPAPSIGGDAELSAFFYNSTFAGFYADGGASGTGTFRRDTGYSYTPAIQVVATDIPSAMTRNDLFSVCLSTVSAPCPDDQALLRANVTYYDGQGVGTGLDVQTWSNK